MSRVKFAATAERPAPPDPHRLQFRAGAEPAQLQKVNAEAGTILGVSLLTANREASGHGVWIDPKTLETFLAQLSGRRLKAYATHGSWQGDGTLDEIGYWESPTIDGIQLRENFVALSAWKKHEEAEFDTLFELAEKLPQEFGASLSFRMTLCWVRPDGTEIPTVRKFREVGGWDYEMYFDPAMPADALRAMPSVRCTEVYSADFVCVPAANEGLFRAKSVDALPKDTPPALSQPASFAMIKEIYAKFSANPVLLAQAIALHTENETATFSEICAKIEGEAIQSELAQLRGVVEANKPELAAFAKLKETVASYVAKLSAAGIQGEAGKSIIDATVAELAKLKADNAKLAGDIQTLRAGGHVALDVGDTVPEGSGSKQKTLAEFNALTPAAKSEFSKAGGIIVGFQAK